MKKLRVITALGLAIGLSSSLGVQPLSAQVLSDNTSYSAYVSPSYELTSPITEARWSAKLDRGEETPFDKYAVVGDGKVYYLQNNKLIAADVASGEKRWESKQNAQPLIHYKDGMVYVLSDAGSLSALSAADGKERWSAQLPQNAVVTKLHVEHDLLFTTTHDKLLAYQLSDGKLLWQAERKGASFGDFQAVVGDVVLASFVESGAITRSNLYAFDLQSGEELWSSGYFAQLLKAEEPYVYIQTRYFMVEEQDTVTIDKINVETGEKTETFKYDTNPNASGRFVDRVTGVKADEEFVYIGTQDCIFHYPLGIDPTRTKPGQTDLDSYSGRYLAWIAGPYQGRLFAEERYGLRAYDAHSTMNEYVLYEGIHSPITYLKIHENGVFAGQLDGSFTITDLTNQTLLMRAEPGVRAYKDIFVENGIVLVEAEHQLFAYPLPDEVKTSPEPTKRKAIEAEATIFIDGVQLSADRDPVFVNNKIFLPFRALFEAFGAEVGYENATKLVTAAYDGQTYEFKPNEIIVRMNDEEAALSEKPFLYKDSIYIPLRDMSELLGAEVKWDSGSRSVKIQTK